MPERPSRVTAAPEIAQLGNGAVDLSQAKAKGKRGPDPTPEQLRLAFELLNGMRCGGCFRRIEHGIRVIKMRLVPDNAHGMKKMRRAACLREDCDYSKNSIRGAVCMEPIEYIWPSSSADPDPDGAKTRAIATD